MTNLAALDKAVRDVTTPRLRKRMAERFKHIGYSDLADTMWVRLTGNVRARYRKIVAQTNKL